MKTGGNRHSCREQWLLSTSSLRRRVGRFRDYCFLSWASIPSNLYSLAHFAFAQAANSPTFHHLSQLDGTLLALSTFGCAHRSAHAIPPSFHPAGYTTADEHTQKKIRLKRGPRQQQPAARTAYITNKSTKKRKEKNSKVPSRSIRYGSQCHARLSASEALRTHPATPACVI